MVYHEVLRWSQNMLTNEFHDHEGTKYVITLVSARVTKYVNHLFLQGSQNMVYHESLGRPKNNMSFHGVTNCYTTSSAGP